MSYQPHIVVLRRHFYGPSSFVWTHAANLAKFAAETAQRGGAQPWAVKCLRDSMRAEALTAAKIARESATAEANAQHILR